MFKFLIIFSFIVVSVANAQTIRCITPGAPGCSRDDFDRALQLQAQQLQQQQFFNQQQQAMQQQQYIQQQQLQEMRRSNELMELQLQQRRNNNMWTR
jgi:hypothetical protein